MTTVDRVGVRVWPDTRGFDRGVRRVTDKRRKTLIQAVLDDREARADLKALKGSKTVIDLDYRIDKAKGRLAELRDQIKRDMDKTVEISADVREARTRIAQLRADLAETSDDAAKVQIKADITEAQARVKRLQADLATVRAHKIEVQADTKVARDELAQLDKDRKVVVQAEADTLAARRELIALARRRVAEIWVRVNSSAAMARIRSVVAGLTGASMLQRWGDSLTGLLSNLPQLTLKLATLGTALVGVATVALSATSAIGPLAASLAQIGPLALAGVAGLGATITTFGVLKAAFADMGTAVTGTGKAAEKAMAKLSPRAREAARELIATKEALSGVQRGIQESYFAGFAAHLRNLGSVTLPQMRTGLAGVAAALGAMTTTGMDALAASLGGGRLKTMFDLTAESIRNASAGMAPFMQGITNVGMAGSTYLPKIGQWAADIGKRFGEWTTHADLVGMIANAATQAGYLWQALKNAGGIVTAVFSAMSSADASGLQGLAETLGSVRGVVESPTFQKALSTVFAGASQGAAALRDALGPVGDSLAQLAPLIGQILSTGGTALAGILQGVAAALAQPAAQNGIQAALAGIAGLAASIPWESLGQSVGILGQAIGLIAPLVTSLLQAIAPLLPPLLSAVLSLIPPLIQIVQAILPALTQIIAALIPVIAALAPVIVALAPLFSALADLLAAVLVPILGALGEIIKVVVVPLIKFLADQIGSMVKIVTALLKGDFAGAWTAVKDHVEGQIHAILGLADWLVKNVLSQIGAWASGMLDKVATMWAGVVAAVQAGVGRVVDWVKGLPGKLVAALGNVGRILLGAGKGIMDGFLNGLRDAWGRVQNFVGGIADWIAAHKGPISVDRRLLVPAAKAIMGGFGATLQAEFRDVQGLVSSFAPTISATVIDGTGTGSAPVATGGTTSVTVAVENMNVRNDSDVRRLAQGIADLTDAKSRAAGNLALGVTG